MRNPFGPLHQGEELLVCCLADIGDRVVGLERKKVEYIKNKTTITDVESSFSPKLDPLQYLNAL